MGSIHGINISHSDNPLSHLLFADDSFVFYSTNLMEAHNLEKVIDIFSRVSVQEINFSKLGIFFSPNTHPKLWRMNKGP